MIREANTPRLRGSMKTMRLRPVVPVVLALALAACSSSPTISTKPVRFPFRTQPLHAVDLSAAPASWVPVAYGDAQVSVPPTWAVMTQGWCGGALSPIIQLGVVVQDLGCPVAGALPAVRITPLGSVPAPYRYEPPVRLDGISALLGPKDATSVTYFVPSLHLEVWANGGSGTRVTDTLAASPRAVVLAAGPAPAVPSSWQWLSFAGLAFSVPALWPVNRTSGAAYGLGTSCRASGVAFPDSAASLLSFGVTLSTDQHLLPPPPCPEELHPYAPQPPIDGVEVDSGPHLQFHVTLSFSKRCLDLHGLTACPAASPAYSILVLLVKVPGRAMPVEVSIGLGGTGEVARTILYSLRAG